MGQRDSSIDSAVYMKAAQNGLHTTQSPFTTPPPALPGITPKLGIIDPEHYQVWPHTNKQTCLIWQPKRQYMGNGTWVFAFMQPNPV